MIDEFIAIPLASDAVFDMEEEKQIGAMPQYSKIIVVTNHLQNAEPERMSAYGDLTVVIVGAHNATSLAESRLYRIIAVSADSVGTRVKNLEL